ncbi:FAD-dependent monooxygenase [Thalassotalea fonticola]|uniref:FAD-dependent monooxygenase n=1 Tax=Thalassotalea fonticola TaxID=3065649 RepID=A0ABZ0GU06_9GAMM|nr:FAD-dependent monooxygenase [Colwelliaceae bacterium S1-1]
MQSFDIVIVGGGMVGLTAALAICKQTPLKIAIIDSQPLNPIGAAPHLRVSAINDASKQLFTNLGVWADITNIRAQAYTNMHVWDKDGFGHVDFDLTDLPNSASNDDCLGTIIENDVIRNALYQTAQIHDNITLIKQTLTSIGVGESEVFLSFTEHTPIIAKLVIGADGANSWVRKQLDMAMTFRDYDHHAVVASVECSQGHQNTAWQVFLNAGPLAFLPLYQKNTCSIVWSLPPEEAMRVKTLSAAEFNKEITAASDGKLGQVSLQSERVSFPLTMRIAREFVKDRVILIGDAAHTIHPLAGQGVNLGLVDASALAQTLAATVFAGKELNDSKLLGHFSRWRKSDATDMIAAMESIKQGFSLQQVLPKFVRGMGMSLINNISPLKQILIKQAMGQTADLPELSKVKDPL